MIDWQTKVHAKTLSAKAFGRDAVLTVSGVDYPVRGALDRSSLDINVVDGQQVTSYAPRFGFSLGATPTPKQNEKLKVLGVNGSPDEYYVIKKVHVDGKGMCFLFLNVDKTKP